MEDLVKKVIKVDGVEYVPWTDVIEFLEATKTETLKESLSHMERALQNLQDSLSKLNDI